MKQSSPSSCNVGILLQAFRKKRDAPCNLPKTPLHTRQASIIVRFLSEKTYPHYLWTFNVFGFLTFSIWILYDFASNLLRKKKSKLPFVAKSDAFACIVSLRVDLGELFKSVLIRQNRCRYSRERIISGDGVLLAVSGGINRVNGICRFVFEASLRFFLRVEGGSVVDPSAPV
jgi:hypothetical protein